MEVLFKKSVKLVRAVKFNTKTNHILFNFIIGKCSEDMISEFTLSEIRELYSKTNKDNIMDDLKKLFMYLEDRYKIVVDFVRNGQKIVVKFNKNLKNIVHNDEYIIVDLSECVKFKSKHSLVMYEIVKLFEKKREIELSLDNVKKLFNVNYENNTTVLETKVIKYSINEINNVTRFQLSHQQLFKKNKIDGFLISISKKSANKNKSMIVTKSNKLINSTYKLSKNAQIIMAMALAKIKPLVEDSDLKYEIDLEVFKNIIGRNDGKWFNDAIEAATSLSVTPIKIPMGVDNYCHCQWVSKFYSNHGRKKSITILFHEELRPYLINLKKEFTKLNIENFGKFSNGYGIRLYELLKQYSTIGKRTIIIEDLKNMLGCNWLNVSLLKKDVINKCVAEINKNTELFVSYTENNRGRKIESLTFTIIDQENAIKLKILELQHENSVKKIICMLPNDVINHKDSKKICIWNICKSVYYNGTEYTIQNINYCLKKNPNPFTPYLISCLKNNYAGYNILKNK